MCAFEEYYQKKVYKITFEKNSLFHFYYKILQLCFENIPFPPLHNTINLKSGLLAKLSWKIKD